MSQVSQVLEDLNDQIVDRIDGRDVRRAEFADAFNRVADKAHWKNPIDATIIVMGGRELEIVLRSIIFFTGSRATSEILRANTLGQGSATYRIRAAGYYAAVGA